MYTEIRGFGVEVTVKDGIPRVLVQFRGGGVVVDSDSLSIQGMENLAEVFECAAKLAYIELDLYWQRRWETRKQQTTTDRVELT
jgi:hypothetical protein